MLKVKKMIYDKSDVMKLVVYHKKGAYTLYNSISGKSMIIRDVVIDEKELENWTSNNTTSKTLMSLVLNELDNEEYEIPLEDIVESVQNERPHKSRMIPA